MFENLGFLKFKFSIFTIGEYRKHGLIKVGEKIHAICDIRDICVFNLALCPGSCKRVQPKWGSNPKTILQIYKQCVRPIFEYGIVSTITVSETVITEIQRLQNSFIRLALHLPKYVSARLSHERPWD